MLLTWVTRSAMFLEENEQFSHLQIAGWSAFSSYSVSMGVILGAMVSKGKGMKLFLLVVEFMELGLFVDFLESRGTLELLPVSLDAVAAINESKSTLDNFIASEKSNGAASSKDGNFEETE